MLLMRLRSLTSASHPPPPGLQLQGRAYRVMLCQVNGPDLGTLAGWVADGKLRPVIAATFPLEQAAVEAAYGQLEGRRVKGKLVCVVAQPPGAAA